MKAYFCQINSLWEDRNAVYPAVTELLEAAQPPPGSLITLPEMFSTGFTFNPRLAEHPLTGPTIEVLSTLASRFKCYVIGGVLAKYPAAARPHNAAIVMGPDGQALARYDKMHLFGFAGEHEHILPGDRTVQIQIDDLMVSPFICYDLRFPEIFRTATIGGAELFVVIANWPAERAAHWTTLLQARAIENQAYVIGVNRCGSDLEHHYNGQSMIIGPKGQILAQADDRPCVMGAELSRDALRAYREEFPAIQDANRKYIVTEE